ncbi:MAG: hypothetical protein AAF715_27975 [Myxococcota bacterium]
MKIELEIDSIGLLGWPEGAADRASDLMERALGLVAERLAGSPWARSGLEDLVLDRLELDVIPVDELLGPRGAERLADELYTALNRRMS